MRPGDPRSRPVRGMQDREDLARLDEALKTVEAKSKNHAYQAVFAAIGILSVLSTILIGVGGYAFIQARARELAERELNGIYVARAESLMAYAATLTDGIKAASQATAQYRLVSGSTPIANTDWQSYRDNKGISLWVDTSLGRFPETPIYLCSLQGNSSHWLLSGINAIYDASPEGFRLYLFSVDGADLTPEKAREFNWHVRWVALVEDSK